MKINEAASACMELKGPVMQPVEQNATSLNEL